MDPHPILLHNFQPKRHLLLKSCFINSSDKCQSSWIMGRGNPYPSFASQGPAHSDNSQSPFTKNWELEFNTAGCKQHRVGAGSACSLFWFGTTFPVYLGIVEGLLGVVCAWQLLGIVRHFSGSAPSSAGCTWNIQECMEMRG